MSGRGDGAQGRAGDGQLGLHDGAAQHQLRHLPPRADPRLARPQVARLRHVLLVVLRSKGEQRAHSRSCRAYRDRDESHSLETSITYCVSPDFYRIIRTSLGLIKFLYIAARL